MVTMQGVIILRISDFRRFFRLGEFLSKRKQFLDLFCEELQRYARSYNKPEALLFVDNERELLLLRLLCQWLEHPDKEITVTKIDGTTLHILDNNETTDFELGRIAQHIVYAKRGNQLTSKTIIGLTLLYVLLGAGSERSDIPIVYEMPDSGKIKDFNECWGDIEIAYSDTVQFPLRRCVFANKNPQSDIRLTWGRHIRTLHPYDCVTGLFCGNVCCVLLPNEIVDDIHHVTLRTTIAGDSTNSRLEVHTANGVEYHDNAVSIGVTNTGQTVWSTADGGIHYPQESFAFGIRVKGFQKQSYADSFLAFADDGTNSDHYIFYAENNVYN